MSVSSRQLAGLLADDGRRRVVAALILEGASTTSAVADRAGLELRTVLDALDRMAAIVSQQDDLWALDTDVFQQAVRAEAEPPTPSEFGDEPAEIARVLDTAFQDGRLVAFPTKRAKRLIVLDHLAQRFEIGQHYPESDVNDTLREVHDDVAMLRRWLVDEQFLDRAGGRYWRCGGSV
ncbi:MAG: DUF2087 domain-containing protein [Actinomycetota bacterium]